MCWCRPEVRTPYCCGRPGCHPPRKTGAVYHPQLGVIPAEPVQSIRLPWDEYFLQMAVNAAERATCPRLHVGAVVTRRNRVLSTGYNGSLPHEPHCDEVGCLMFEGHCLRTIHAEANAIKQAEGRDPDCLYCTHYPCLYCLKDILAAGIRRIVYLAEYKPMPARDFFVENFTGELTIIQKSITLP